MFDLGALAKLFGQGTAPVPQISQVQQLQQGANPQQQQQRLQMTQQPQRPQLHVQAPAAPRVGAGWSGLQQSTSFDGGLNGRGQNPQISPQDVTVYPSFGPSGVQRGLQGSAGVPDTSYSGGADAGGRQQFDIQNYLNRFRF